MSFLQTNATEINLSIIYTTFIWFGCTFFLSGSAYVILSWCLSEKFSAAWKQSLSIVISLSVLFFYHYADFLLFYNVRILGRYDFLSFIDGPLLKLLLISPFVLISIFASYHYNYLQNILINFGFILNITLGCSIAYTYYTTHQKIEKNLEVKGTTSLLAVTPKDSLPLSSEKEWKQNVYVIVTDGYPRYDSLKKHTGFDNKNVLDFLKSKGFFIIEKSTSNYPITFLSLQSLLSADYTYNEKSGKYSRDEAYHSLGGKNKIVQAFTQHGYQYVHVGSGAWAGSECAIDNAKRVKKTAFLINLFSLSEEATITLLSKTPLKRYLLSPKDIVVTLDDIYFYLKRNLPYLEKPIFLFAHTLPPHAPFIFDAKCNTKFTFQGNNLGSTQDSKEDFLDNLQCVNRQLENLLNFIITEDPDAVVAIISDHGSDFSVNWSASPEKWSKESVEERFANSIAIRAPLGFQKYLYSTMSLVNLFPFIFSVLDERAPNFLPDESFITVYENSAYYGKFTKVSLFK